MTPVVNITSATQVGSFSLRLLFDDGTERVDDFEPFLPPAPDFLLEAVQRQQRHAA